MKRTYHLIFAGGGTGGHLFPGLTVAQQLARDIRRLRITFVGGGKEFERRTVAAAGFEYFALPCRPLPRGPRDAVSFLVENFAGYLAAKRFLREEQVAGVVGLGGYASVPAGRAAAKLDVPLILMEQNVLPGRATRWLAAKAALLCASFPQTAAELAGRCPIRVTGNPVRGHRLGGTGVSPVLPESTGKMPAPPDATASSPRQLLVLGGSSGARSLNESVPRAIYKSAAALGGWRIVHQSGEADLVATRQLYGKLAIDASVVAFLHDLPDVLSASQLAVCRAGGTTLAELAAAGLPAVLVPYPHAAANHQHVNAEVFSSRGAAALVDERDLPGRLDDRLAEVMTALAGDADRRAKMSAAMFSSAYPDAAANVAALVWSVVSSQARRRVAAAA